MTPTNQTMQRNKQLLIIDDDSNVVEYLVEVLAASGYRTSGEIDPQSALRRLETEHFDLVISDVEMPGMRGLDLMSAIHARKPGQLVLLITAFGSIDLGVRSLQAGACGFVTKPFSINDLTSAIDRAFRDRQMRREVVRVTTPDETLASRELVAESQKMQKILQLANRAAQIDSPVLLTGESGVGKGALARFIHDHSSRCNGPFLQVNCAALPFTLVESELFGVRKGAYTDARENRPGLFVEAKGGTLFLDEIAEMPLTIQPKLLQVLETGKVRPVGAGSEIATDVRIIAATNQPIEKALQNGLMRSDLYYRLNVIRLDIPPLRERSSDLDRLVNHLLQNAQAKLQRQIHGISIEAMRWIRAYSWPGNVRELANTLERAVALTEHDTILLEDLAQATQLPIDDDLLNKAANQSMTLAELEIAYIHRILEITQGNKVQAAKILGIDRGTLYRKLGDDSI
ncbi:sigma-54-dependent transcriptional regulator [Methylobacter sp. YRD-M1]|uniref:sigma-54-dependent transcriptional regulator n=1 Tax=Methylobacter sp. YRD-M1 TaxID=2911520 RepID=UPI00227AE93F|nr:sigma-54 dependent transcriptional regulator [Methylobacter sp. YRD-M1]WAK02626.1 sigma-54 dependent transcriptional regulator [Methylobacter sp. YRD-M1]